MLATKVSNYIAIRATMQHDHSIIKFLPFWLVLNGAVWIGHKIFITMNFAGCLCKDMLVIVVATDRSLWVTRISIDICIGRVFVEPRRLL